MVGTYPKIAPFILDNAVRHLQVPCIVAYYRSKPRVSQMVEPLPVGGEPNLTVAVPVQETYLQHLAAANRLQAFAGN